MSNEAAERLRDEIRTGAEYPPRRKRLLREFDAALDTERKATVERIRTAWTFDHKGGECEYPHEQFDAILDAEAAR